MRNVFYGFFLLLATIQMQVQGQTARVAKKPAAVLKLTKADYTDRMEAIWASQIICQIIALRFENFERAVTWVDNFPRKMDHAPVDDDWYYEMITIKAFEKYGSKMTIEQLGEQWLKDSCGVWGSSRQAKLAMLKGLKPPATGNPYNNQFYYTIGPQFSSDIYGALTPGMPNLAAKLARYYGHINGYAEGADGAVFIAGAISAAFAEKNLRTVVEQAAGLISDASPYKECLNMVLASADKGMKAAEIFEQIENRWRTEYPAPNNAVANGGIMAVCLLYGEGDFLKTLNLACSAADYSDADCNAASAGAVLSAMYGTKLIPRHLLDGLHNRIKGDKMWKAPLPPVDETISSLAERSVNVAASILKDNGISMVNDSFTIPVQKTIMQPAELFDNNELVNAWGKGWKVERAKKSVYLEGDVLTTFPVTTGRGMYLYKKMTADENIDSLTLTVAADFGRCWQLVVMADNDKLLTRIIEADSTGEKWQTITIDLSKYKGREFLLRLYQNIYLPDRFTGNAYWKKLSFAGERNGLVKKQN